MTFQMNQGQSVQVAGSPVTAQLDANGNPVPSKATLSSPAYQSSDPTVFTLAADPSAPLGAIIVSVGPGSATLTESATATEPDGTTTEKITGSATIIIAVIPPPPPPPAVALVMSFGNPFPTPPAPPPPPAKV